MTVGDDVVIKASWHVESNWDHMEAFAFNPEAPGRKRNVLQVFHRCALGGVGACCGVVR